MLCYVMLPTRSSQNKSINAFTGWTWCEIDCLFIWRFYIWSFGFPLHFEGLRISFYANYNLLSAEQNPEIVSTIYKWSRGLTACSPLGILLLKKRRNYIIYFICRNYIVGSHCDRLRSCWCRTFDMFNTALETVANAQLNISHLVHILDDSPTGP
jgi:hypothetical protein